MTRLNNLTSNRKQQKKNQEKKIRRNVPMKKRRQSYFKKAFSTDFDGIDEEEQKQKDSILYKIKYKEIIK